MAKDPGFLFYPGDYLRDTQCLSEAVQVAYDRIMCEHMRNICISQQQLDFFTKKLTNAEKTELSMVITKTNNGFQISWVADSIMKYNAFRQSRSNNRAGKTKEHKNKISNTSDKHMDIDIESDIENEKLKKGGMGEGRPLIQECTTWDQEKENFMSDGGWQIMFSKSKDVTFDRLQELMKEFLIDLELKQDFKGVREIQSHFTNWFNKKKDNNGNRSVAGGSANRKNNGVQQLVGKVKAGLRANGAGE